MGNRGSRSSPDPESSRDPKTCGGTRTEHVNTGLGRVLGHEEVSNLSEDVPAAEPGSVQYLCGSKPGSCSRTWFGSV